MVSEFGRAPSGQAGRASHEAAKASPPSGDHPSRGANGQAVEILTIGGQPVEVDIEIADLVRVLNENGYPTRASCSGHGRVPASIILRDGRELHIVNNRDEGRMIEDALRISQTMPGIPDAAIPSFGNVQHGYSPAWDYVGCPDCGWVKPDATSRRGTAARHDEWFPSLGAFEHFKRTGVRAWIGGSSCDAIATEARRAETTGSACGGAGPKDIAQKAAE